MHTHKAGSFPKGNIQEEYRLNHYTGVFFFLRNFYGCYNLPSVRSPQDLLCPAGALIYWRRRSTP